MNSLTPLTSYKVFTREQFNNMDEEERQFAREQLRAVFSHEMSKISAAISKRRQVSNKLMHIEEESEAELQRRMSKLNEKMISVEVKRKQQLQKRIENCKLHDDDWQRRIKQIDQKIKESNRDATIKLRKFKEEYDQYLANKRQRTIASVAPQRRPHLQPHQRHVYTEEFQTRRPSAKTQKVSKNSSQHQTLHKKEIDQDIREHQEKSRKIKETEENRTLQKALNKLEQIKQRRTDVIEKKSPPARPLSDGSKNRRRSAEDRNDSEERDKIKADIRKFEVPSTSSNPQRSKTLSKMVDRRVIRQKINQAENQQRWSAFEKSLKKNKKEQILKTIKDKVAQYRLMAQRL